MVKYFQHMSWKLCGRKQIWLKLKYCPGIFLKRMMKTNKNLIKYIRCPFIDSNWFPPEWKSEAVLSETTWPGLSSSSSSISCCCFSSCSSNSSSSNSNISNSSNISSSSSSSSPSVIRKLPTNPAHRGKIRGRYNLKNQYSVLKSEAP